jgi:hypothetical protein
VRSFVNIDSLFRLGFHAPPDSAGALLQRSILVLHWPADQHVLLQDRLKIVWQRRIGAF